MSLILAATRRRQLRLAFRGTVPVSRETTRAGIRLTPARLLGRSQCGRAMASDLGPLTFVNAKRRGRKSANLNSAGKAHTLWKSEIDLSLYPSPLARLNSHQ